MRRRITGSIGIVTVAVLSALPVLAVEESPGGLEATPNEAFAAPAAVSDRAAYCGDDGLGAYRVAPDTGFRGFAEVGPFGRPVFVAPDLEADPLARLEVVPGSRSSSGRGRLLEFRIEIERGLAIDPRCFGAAVEAALWDERSWISGRKVRFARVDGPDADFIITLASPDTTDELCRPLRTGGVLSCRRQERVILNFYRWVNGARAFGSDLDGYRRYLVNHEVGHILGHGHTRCPGEGESAPVMMQQTKGVGDCVANSWPLPGEHGG